MSSFERFGLQDRVLLETEDASHHMHVAGAFLFEAAPLTRSDGGLDIDLIRDYVDANLYRVPRFRQRVRYVPLERHPVWVDDDGFHIHYHVRHTRLPLPGDERQLKRLCGRIISQQLDRGKPLWEMWLVEGLQPDRFALLTKTHHCMIDGVSGVDLLQALLTPTPKKRFELGPVWLPRPALESRQLLRDALSRRLRTPLVLGNTLLRAAREPGESFERARDSVEGLLASGRAQAQRGSETPLNRPIGPHRRLDWLAFDLDDVKRVKNRLGGTVNDVVLATVAGALRRFFEQRGITPREQEELEIRVACPVSTRPESDRGRLGNQVSGLIVSLPVSEPDPRRRLALVVETMREAKASKQAAAAEAMNSLGAWTSPRLLTALARSRLMRRSFNLNVSNIPGPQTRLYLLDAPMTETYPVIPLTAEQGLAIGLFSYAGGLYWGFNTDWELLPDLHDLVLATDASFRELCDAA